MALADTNILIYSVQNNIDIVSEAKGNGFSLVTSSCVMEELKKLSFKNIHARISLNVFSSLETVEGSGTGDDCILNLCRDKGFALISNDRVLSRRAMELGIKVMNIEDGRKITWRR